MSDVMLLETCGLTKRYGDFKAIDNVDFSLCKGEVHVLFGENGAGKSTLISILAGANNASEGSVTLLDEPYLVDSVRTARAKGVSAVFQEFSLAPTLSVAANIYLGNEPLRLGLIDHKRMHKNARELLDELGFALNTTTRVVELSRAQQQMVEIAKACRENPIVLILDEPTASLSDHEVDRLFEFVERLVEQGVGVIYISHRIQEFRRIAQQVTVMRDGKIVAKLKLDDVDDDTLVASMVGRPIEQLYPKIQRVSGKEVLRVSGLRSWGVHGVSFSVNSGEVLGVAGLVGSGKSRVFRAIAGLLDRTDGQVILNKVDASRYSTAKILAAGLVYVTADRKNEGLQMSFDVDENLEQGSLSHPSSHYYGWLDRNWIMQMTDKLVHQVSLSNSYRNRLAVQLSGGNQQKLLFGRALSVSRDVYIFDEPTVGVDVGARSALYEVIKSLAESGAAVVIISSDLPEVIHLSHRMLVFSKGNISAELEGATINEDTILAHFFSEVGNE